MKFKFYNKAKIHIHNPLRTIISILPPSTMRIQIPTAIMFSEEKKKFIIHSNGRRCFVYVKSTSNLSDVRKSIIEEFDNHHLPSRSEAFEFEVNGVRYSPKQEARENAFKVLEAKATVEIFSNPLMNNDRSRKIDNEVTPTVKKAKKEGARQEA